MLLRFGIKYSDMYHEGDINWIDNDYISGDFVENISIYGPAFVVDFISYMSYLADMNYVEIKDFKRFYFITNIVLMENQQAMIYCQEDILNTFIDTIRTSEVLITRSEKYYDKYLKDGLATTSSEFDFEFQHFDNEILNSDDFYDTGYYQGSYYGVVNVVNDGQFNEPEKSNSEENAEEQEIEPRSPSQDTTSIYGDIMTGFNVKYIVQPAQIPILCKDIIQGENFGDMFADRSQYINNIILFPFSLNNFTASSGVEKIRVGNVETSAYGLLLGESKYQYAEQRIYIKYFGGKYGDWRDFEITYNLHLPYYGMIQLNAKEIYKRVVGVFCNVDLYNGELAYYIMASRDTYDEQPTYPNPIPRSYWYVIDTYSTKVGMELSIGHNSAGTQELTYQQSKNNSAVSTAVGVVSVIAGAMLIATGVGVGAGVSVAATGIGAGVGATTAAISTGAVAAGAGMLLSGAANAASGTLARVNANMQNEINTLVKGNTQLSRYNQYNNDELYEEFIYPKYPYDIFDDEYLKSFGSPTMKIMKLNECSGYIQTGEIGHLIYDREKVIPTKDETELLIDLLKHGVHLK